jgi:hypothetical protein
VVLATTPIGTGEFAVDLCEADNLPDNWPRIEHEF